MTNDQPQAKTRSRKLYVLWAIALTLLLSLGAFCWLVVVPVWQVHSVAGDYQVRATALAGKPAPFEREEWLRIGRRSVDLLGGHQSAASRLRSYLGLPKLLTGNRQGAAALLYFCGEAGAPVLVDLLKDSDPEVQIVATVALAQLGPVARPALGKIGPDAKAAITGGGSWKNGQAVELVGTVRSSKADARFYLETEGGRAVHLKGKVMDSRKFASGERLRVKGHIEYVRHPLPKGTDASKLGVALPQTFCYLHVTKVEKLGDFAGTSKNVSPSQKENPK